MNLSAIRRLGGANLGTRQSLSDIGQTIAENFGVEIADGESFFIPNRLIALWLLGFLLDHRPGCYQNNLASQISGR